MTSLARHARDEHQWEGGQCDFHAIRVCSCGECKQGELKCEGREYHTKYVLSCPLHSLAYEIECEYRASMADDLVHPTLKWGHSNLMEASHNVLIRFRPKHIHLERLHYEDATNLGLLQANMMYLYEKRGPNYHWIPDCLVTRLLSVLPYLPASQANTKVHKAGSSITTVRWATNTLDWE